jgi:urease accessory protein
MDDLLLWQLADSAFPSGAFAHSGGLEAAWRQGEVEAQSLGDFLAACLRQSAHGQLPFTLAVRERPSEFTRLDARLHAFLVNHVVRRASLRQGSALIASAAAIFGDRELLSLRDRLRNAGDREGEAVQGHFAAALGMVAARLQLSREATAKLYLFITLRDLISSAVRLGLVGPLAGQSLLRSLTPLVEALAARAIDRRPEEAAQTAPVLDVLMGAQDRLYTRLFQS